MAEEEFLRSRVRHFLKEEAKVRSGGDLVYNPGLLIGDGRKKRRGGDMPEDQGLLIGDGRRKRRGGASPQSIKALEKWQKHLQAYRREHPGMSYREAQKRAKATF